MRIKLAVSCTAIALLPLAIVLPRAATAQVNVQIQIPLPTIRFETPPVLVEVSPGVQVVQDYDEEVFFVDGWYWTRSGPTWYRARDHRGGWVVAHGREVPRNLRRLPPGRYKHYRAEHPHGKDQRRERGPHGHDGRPRHQEHDDRKDNHHDDDHNHDDHKKRGEHQEHHGSNKAHR